MLKIKPLMLCIVSSVGIFFQHTIFADINIETSKKLIKSEQAERQVHTRGLAASCVVCHGVSDADNSLNKLTALAGMKASYIAAQLHAFKSGELAATVMHHHAKGLNSEEIADLAEYFSSQKLSQSIALPSQKLLENHDH